MFYLFVNVILLSAAITCQCWGKGEVAVCFTNLLCLVKFTLKAEQTTADQIRGKSIEAGFHYWDCIFSFYISNRWKWLGTMPGKVKQWTSMSIKRALYESPVKQSWCRSVCCPGVMDRNSILEPAAYVYDSQWRILTLLKPECTQQCSSGAHAFNKRFE